MSTAAKKIKLSMKRCSPNGKKRLRFNRLLPPAFQGKSARRKKTERKVRRRNE
jgi:hypothetical protein